jgi:hypothetical protein
MSDAVSTSNPWRVTILRVGEDHVIHLHAGDAQVTLPALEAHKLGSALHAASSLELDRADDSLQTVAADAEAVDVMAEKLTTAIAERDLWQAAFDRIALDPTEYRHALDHVVECEDNCGLCRDLARRTLDYGVDAEERAAAILAERDRLRAVIRKLVDGAGIAVNGPWIDCAAGEYGEPCDLTDEEIVAYQDAIRENI